MSEENTPELASEGGLPSTDLFAAYSGLKDVFGKAYRGDALPPDETIAKKWRVYEPSSAADLLKWGGRIECEDLSILTVDGEEVVGCSEWMRADREVFLHIVALHNAWLDSATKTVMARRRVTINQTNDPPAVAIHDLLAFRKSMITKTKLRIAKGEVYLAEFAGERKPLHILDVVKRQAEDGPSMVRHQYGWDTLPDFVEMDPVRIGKTRKILGIRCGVIREANENSDGTAASEAAERSEPETVPPLPSMTCSPSVFASLQVQTTNEDGSVGAQNHPFSGIGGKGLFIHIDGAGRVTSSSPASVTTQI